MTAKAWQPGPDGALWYVNPVFGFIDQVTTSLFQVNITIPQNAPTGDRVTLIVKSADGSVTSNVATIAVRSQTPQFERALVRNSRCTR